LTLVAVASNKFTPGTDSDNDWRDPTPRAKRARADLRVRDLTDAIGDAYPTDAHLVTYIVRGPDGVPLDCQPRVRKTALDWLLAERFTVDCDVLVCDVDNDGHADWTPAATDRAFAEYDTLPVLSTCGVYHTTHGRRFMQPLDEPVSVSEVERYLTAWLRELESSGIAVDWSCRDWTRMFRLAHVRRGHVDYRSPVVRLARMRPRTITPAREVAPLPPKDERPPKWLAA
jgi:hypothetical protein